MKKDIQLHTKRIVKDYFEVKSKIDAKTFKDMLANPDHSLADVYSKKIEAENADFDPNLHLAVMQESVDGVEANKVVVVLQKGYKLGNKVLRASMVKVSC